MRRKKIDILAVRLSAMGDVAMTSPVLSALCRQYPDIKVSILTSKGYDAFFPDMTQLDVIDIDTKEQYVGIWGVVKLFFKLINRYKVSNFVDLHDVIRSKMLRKMFRAIGVNIIVIDKGREEKDALTRIENKVFTPLKSTIERYADTLERAGYKIDMPAAAEKVVFGVPLKISCIAGEKKGRWIGIAPFAQHSGKIYPLDKMKIVIDKLVQQGDITIFLFGGGSKEKAVTEELEAQYKDVCISVIGKIALNEEIQLISNLDCMVSMDSSAMHMASIVGARVVSIWGATHPYAGFLGFGQSVNDVVEVDIPCRPCSIYGNKPCVREDYKCLNSISPDSILDVINR